MGEMSFTANCFGQINLKPNLDRLIFTKKLPTLETKAAQLRSANWPKMGKLYFI